jgi:hypothetical protein
MGGVELTKINTVIRAATTIVKLQIIYIVLYCIVLYW